MTQSLAIYLASPIDEAAGRTALMAQRSVLTHDLNDAGFSVYRPDLAWTTGPQPEPAIQAVNQAALDHCAALVALLPADVPTIGTVLEIEQVARSGRPVVVVTDRRSFALESLAGVLIVETVEHAVATMKAARDTGTLQPACGLDGRPLVAPAPLPFTVDASVGGWALPRRFHADDAGLDLFVTENTTIDYREFGDVPAGVRVELPPGTWGLIVGRSSTMRKRGLLVVPGVIDVGWRGDLFVGAVNVSGHPVTVSRGERIGQLVLMPNLTERHRPTLVDGLSEHPRGESGFGSTGGYTDSDSPYPANGNGQPALPFTQRDGAPASSETR